MKKSVKNFPVFSILFLCWALLSGICVLPMVLLVALAQGSLFSTLVVLVLYFGHLAVLKKWVSRFEYIDAKYLFF